ncbi:FAD-binding oxidoreductase [bacterium SCSIO 12741]|nr:FAD-binding oxidoreductase [bacterium SCSIO 12741]
MNFSYWEQKEWIGKPDLVVIGSGITGLSAAYFAKKQHPDWHILVLERGMLPWGASSRNAGFACFGSLGELLDDLNHHDPEEIKQLVLQRYQGLQGLLSTFGTDRIGFHRWGGYELFRDSEAWEEALANRERINDWLKYDLGPELFRQTDNTFGFSGIQGLLFNPLEGQLDTGRLMQCLLEMVQRSGILVLNGAQVEEWSENPSQVTISVQGHPDIQASRVLICSNGFAQSWLGDSVQPARAQVLVTKPMPHLNIQGTFHLDRGYYYFRNIDGRVLLGGGRQLDKQGETTTEMVTTDLIQSDLRTLMNEVILPGQKWELERSWSGIMGVGSSKSPWIAPVSDRVGCAVRLGGMGVALGMETGKRAALLAGELG